MVAQHFHSPGPQYAWRSAAVALFFLDVCCGCESKQGMHVPSIVHAAGGVSLPFFQGIVCVQILSVTLLAQRA